MPSFQVKQGTFNKPASTGVQEVTLVGFKPKALLLWGTHHDTVGFNADARASFGFTDGINQFATSGRADDDGGATNAGRSTASGCYLMSGPNLAVAEDQAEIVSFEADGFKIDWTTLDATFTSIIHYLALGGDDLNAFVSNFRDSGIKDGDQSITGVGFEPSALITAHNEVGLLDVSVLGSGGIGLGIATSSAQMGMRTRSFLSSSTTRGQRVDELILLHSGWGSDPGGPLYRSAAWKTMDSDGFTVTWNDTTGFVTHLHGYLALSGIAAAVGVETQPTSVSEQVVTGLRFTPSWLLLYGFNRTAAGAPRSPFVDHCRHSIGGSDGTTEGGMGYYHDSDSTDARDLQFTDKIIEFADVDAPAATEAEADLKAFDADGYTLDWTKADAVERQFFYLALGTAPPPLPPVGEHRAGPGVERVGGLRVVEALSVAQTVHLKAALTKKS